MLTRGNQGPSGEFSKVPHQAHSKNQTSHMAWGMSVDAMALPDIICLFV